MSKRAKVSVVVPFYNEEDCIGVFLQDKLMPELDKIKAYNKEVVLVNDGSTDKSLTVIKDIWKGTLPKEIKLVSLARNFGKEIATSVGLRIARGDAVIMIDADGQQPPELISDFIKKWEGGAEMVVGVRDHYTKHGWFAKVGSKMFYSILRAMGNKDLVPGSTDYRLLDRTVVDEYNKFTEHNRITRGLIDWMGFQQDKIYYEYDARMAGKPSNNFGKLFRLAINSFISLSTTPLVIFGYVGLAITILSFLLGMFVIVQQYILGDPMGLYWNGAVQMAIFIAFLIGLVLISQAIMALYVSHIHAETQNRPLFIISKRNSINLEEADEENIK